jgi:hypothetical protein
MKKLTLVYDENIDDVYGWRVYKNDSGEVYAIRQSPCSSTSTPWISDKNKIRKSLPKKIKAIIERELTNL